MKVREDIFPEIEGYEKTQDILQGLANLGFRAFNGLFSSKDEVIQYINSFEKPEIARRFLEIGEFYYFAKFYYCPKCFPPKQIEKCPYCKNPFEMPAYLVLITIISIMERLSRDLSEYVDFFEWTGDKKLIDNYQIKLELSGQSGDFGKLVLNLREDWRKDYGSVTKITDFFRKFLKKEEKIEFIKSIRYLIKVPELPPKHMENIDGKKSEEVSKIFENWKKTIEEEQQLLFETDDDIKNYVIRNNSKVMWEALPICFNKEEYWKCYSRDSSGRGLGYCHYNYYCPLDKNEKLLDDCFNKIVKTVYDWRSEFLHDARIPPIRETAMLGGIYKKKPIIVELTTTELKPVFERMLKRYFDQYQMEE
jgi:hypothetical protein